MEEPIGQQVSQIYRLSELNTEQIRALNRDKTAVLIPGGILEEHGPYLPCCTDTYESEHLAQELASEIVKRPGWNVLIFPTIPLGHGGANGIGGKDVFPGTYTVRATTIRAVFMDLASELGEQGFRWIFVVNVHMAPSNNRPLHQACAYFNDVYGGKMVHLMGLLDFSILDGILSEDDQKVAGVDIHAAAGETSWMLFVRPDLVDPAYKQAVPWCGETWDDLERVARMPGWPGYLGAPAKATVAYGAAWVEKLSTTVITLAMKILDGENVDAAARKELTPLEDEGWAQRKQHEWLEKNGLL